MSLSNTEDLNVVVVDSSELRRGWRAKVTRPIVGIALSAVGALFIVLGYWGVAHETLVAKQIPYLVSGGIGGMVLVATGAFLLGTDDVRRQLERVERLEAMIGDLHDALLDAQESPTAAAARPPAAAPIITPAMANGPAPVVAVGGSPARIVALPRGKSYHLAECTMVAGKHADAVDAGTIAERGLAPCPLCDPATVLVAR